MNMRMVLWGFAAIAALGAAGFAGWVLTLPAAQAARAMPPIAQDETDATLAALKPPKRARPLIAIIGVNEGTETTDYLMPYGILKRADVADVVAVATRPGAIALYPALKVMAEATVADFDAKYPQGADYVIVPAMHRDDDPDALRWIRAQAVKGATVIGVCAGAMVVAETGLLDGKRATTHWYYLKGLREKPIRYVADRRIVIDKGIVTTTGITASMPMMLTLIEAIAGRDRATAVGRDLGVARWDARHDSNAFKFTRPFAVTAMGNTAAFWNREQFGIALTPGMDEVALALVADAWSRTYRSNALTYADTVEPVATRSGLRVVPDRVATDWPRDTKLPAIDRKPAEELDATLKAIGARYGAATSDFVAMQLEYPR